MAVAPTAGATLEISPRHRDPLSLLLVVFRSAAPQTGGSAQRDALCHSQMQCYLPKSAVRLLKQFILLMGLIPWSIRGTALAGAPLGQSRMRMSFTWLKQAPSRPDDPACASKPTTSAHCRGDKLYVGIKCGFTNRCFLFSPLVKKTRSPPGP